MFIVNKKRNSHLTFDSLVQGINEKTTLVSNIIVDLNKIEEFYIELLALIINNVDVVVNDNDTCEENNDTSVINKVVLKDIDHVIRKLIISTSKISLFTSGTTGEPKKISHSVTRFIQMCVIKNSVESSVWALLYNPTHMGGLQVFFQAFLNKNLIVYLFETDRNLFLKSCEQYEITHVSATPTFYRLLGPFDFILPKIKRYTLGGEKSDSRLLSNLKGVFINAKVNNIYASTEAGSLFVSRGDVFEILPSIKNKVRFIDNEIVLHYTLLGDFNKAEWFYTGDIVEFINDKEFAIVSRKSDYINIGGNRVNLDEVEQLIRKLEVVANVSVSTQENSVLGKVLVANVILNTELNKKEFKKLLKTVLKNYMIPTKINFVRELEVTKSGKLTRL